MKRLLFILIFTPLLLAGCKADFSPNADWKEVPSVYCLLDQDDSVTYVRVQKCYLGDENLKNYASIADSSNYAPGELQVRIYVWQSQAAVSQAGASPLKTLDFNYEVLPDKPAGTFAYPNQPVYSHVNQPGDLNPNHYYQLVITRISTGEILAKAETDLIGDAKKEIWLDSPHPNIIGRTFSFRKNHNCSITWLPFTNGRRYQITLGFRYRCRYQQPDSLRGFTMSCADVISHFDETTLTVPMSQSTYMSNIVTFLAGDTMAKVFVDTVSIALAIGNEPLNAYLNSIDMMRGSLDQDQQVYTNIEGGVGLFASRRTHLMLLVPTDGSDSPPTGMHYLLENLGVGFEKY